MKSLPRRGSHQVRSVLKQEEGGGQDGPDAQEVDGDINRLENKTYRIVIV